MEIASFPGPQNASRIGFGLEADKFATGDARRWAQAGVGWIAVTVPLGRPVPSELIGALIQHGIEPVLGLDRSPISAIDQRALQSALATYREAGGRYTYVYRYPNLARAWESDEWGRAHPVRLLAGFLRPCLTRVLEAGLIPLLPPLLPGGDYWDTAFLTETLEILMSENPELVEAAGIATVTPLDRDLHWGAGGRVRWPEARPFHTPPDSQDHRGFQIFAWYDEINQERVGRSLPQVAVASYPASGGPIQRTTEAAGLAQGGSLPPYLLCINLGPLQAADGAPAPAMRMLADGLAVPAEPEAGQIPEPHATEPDSGTLPAQEAEADGEARPSNGAIRHYLLFPTWDFGVSEWYWRMATEYIRTFQPACGFRPEEAALARYVTIIGDERGVTARTEQDLAARGCRVERIAGEDAESTRKILDSMVKQGQRFLNGEETLWS